MQTTVEKAYNYSKHSYCIAFGFDEDQLYINRFFSGYRSQSGAHCNRVRSVSILYNIETKTVLAWGVEANQRKSEAETNKNVFHVNNIFTELNIIHRRLKAFKVSETKGKQYTHAVHDDLIKGAAVRFLMNVLHNYRMDMGGLENDTTAKDHVHLPPHYAFFVPTDWDFEIRKEIIRPLFEEAGLMAKSDHDKKLLFFTQLETTFQYLQAQDPSTDLTIQTPIVNGQRLIMYGLKFAGDNLSVRLDLFSAEYPNLQSLGTHYIAKTIKSIHFHVSLASNVEEGIENCLKARAFNLEEKKYRKLLNEMIKQYQENGFISSTSNQKLSQMKIHNHRPFKQITGAIRRMVLTKEEYEKLQSITMEEIHKKLFGSIIKKFKETMENETMPTDRAKIRTAILILIKIQDLLEDRLEYRFSSFTAWMVYNWLKDWVRFAGQQTSKAKTPDKNFEDKEKTNEMGNEKVKDKKDVVNKDVNKKNEDEKYEEKNKDKVKKDEDKDEDKKKNGGKKGGNKKEVVIDLDNQDLFRQEHFLTDYQYNLMEFGKNQRIPSFEMPWTDMQEGNNLMIRDEIQLSNTSMPPSLIPRSKLDRCEILSTFQPDNSRTYEKTLHTVDCKKRNPPPEDLSNLQLVNLKNYSNGKVLSFVELESFSNNKEISPLSLVKLEGYSNAKELSTEPIDDEDDEDEIAKFSQVRLKPSCIIHLDISLEKTYLTIASLDPEDPTKIITKYHAGDSYTFLIRYLCDLNWDIVDQKMKFKTFDDIKIGYIVSIEKYLLDSVFGSRRNLTRLLYKSDILQKADNCTISSVITQGDRILPVIKKELGLKLKLKSYSVMAQLHENYVQVTLQQVVNLDPIMTIIVQDKIIPIDNVSDSLCKSIWEHIVSTKEINCCTNHTRKEKGLCDLFSLNNYVKISGQLKKVISEMFLKENNFNLQQKFHIKFEGNCAYQIDISYQHIIDIAIEPILRNIATIIAASVVRSDHFQDYVVEHLFVLGTIFNTSRGSDLDKACYLIMQKVLDDSINDKEKDYKGFVLQDPFHHMLNPDLKKQVDLDRTLETPHLFEVVSNGNLEQVARETYAIYVKNVYKDDIIYPGDELRPFLSIVDIGNERAGVLGGRDAAMIVLQRGQSIPITGLTQKFKMHNDYFKQNADTSGFQLEIDLVRLNNLNDATLEQIVSLDGYLYDVIDCFSLHRENAKSDTPIRLEIKHINHNSSLQFSFRMVGDGDDYQNARLCIAIGEQLTVAFD
ncbi:hypothetical protein INT47_000064 [Mucor saturninus]|uniref:Uncharacterized protein n=1 Tax=Mucor saturninus TaxID=64648 RepID=A0A8H7RI41_9FUNG|nr:hypothetical protein INT47_000064 [Mucor saturninus]